MENNDLQRAIDEIANNASDSQEAGDLEQIQDQLGVPPMPPVSGMEGNTMQDSGMNSLPTVDGMDSSPTPAMDGDLNQIRENALKELLPIMEKTQADPFQKYNLYRDAVLTLHDQGAVRGAYDSARQISDEGKRADALLDIVNIIDRM